MRECERYLVKSTTLSGTKGIVTMKTGPLTSIAVSVYDLEDILAAIKATGERTVVLSTFWSPPGDILGIHVPLETDVKSSVPIFIIAGRVVAVYNSVESQIRFCDTIEKEMEMLECKPKGDSS